MMMCPVITGPTTPWITSPTVVCLKAIPMASSRATVPSPVMSLHRLLPVCSTPSAMASVMSRSASWLTLCGPSSATSLQSWAARSTMSTVLSTTWTAGSATWKAVLMTMPARSVPSRAWSPVSSRVRTGRVTCVTAGSSTTTAMMSIWSTSASGSVSASATAR